MLDKLFPGFHPFQPEPPGWMSDQRVGCICGVWYRIEPKDDMTVMELYWLVSTSMLSGQERFTRASVQSFLEEKGVARHLVKLDL